MLSRHIVPMTHTKFDAVGVAACCSFLQCVVRCSVFFVRILIFLHKQVSGEGNKRTIDRLKVN